MISCRTVAGDAELLTRQSRFTGVNYYQPRRVKARANAVNPGSPFMPEWFFDYYEMPGRKMNPHRGLGDSRKGIYDILTNLRDNYGNIPSYISENGMGVEGEENSSLMVRSRMHIVSILSATTCNGYTGISENCAPGLSPVDLHR